MAIGTTRAATFTVRSLVVLVVASGSAVAGQHVTHGVNLPIAVDGAKTPDRIPDDVAYRHFISVTSIPDNASAEQLARRNAFLGRIALSKADRASYVAALVGIRDQLDRIAREKVMASTARGGSGALRAALKLQERQTLDHARARLSSLLTPEGSRVLDAHIQRYVKKRIVIYGDAQ